MHPLLEGKTKKHRDFVRSGLGSWRMVFDGRYKLVRGFDAAEVRAARLISGGSKEVPPMLFDLEADPMENSDIAGNAPDVVARLSGLLAPTRGGLG